MSGFIQDEDSLDMLECNGLNISEFDARQLEYIRKLQERNRLKRQLEKKSKSKEERRKEKRERGFNLQVMGANTDRIKRSSRHDISGPSRSSAHNHVKSSDQYSGGSEHSQTSKNKGQQRKKRKGWNVDKRKNKPKNLERSNDRSVAISPGNKGLISKDAYPFAEQRVTPGDSPLLKQPSNCDNSVDYSDESFEEYDSEASDDNHGSAFEDRKKKYENQNEQIGSTPRSNAVLDIFNAVQQSQEGLNALRQSLASINGSDRNGIIQQSGQAGSSRKAHVRKSLTKTSTTRSQSAKSNRRQKEAAVWGSGDKETSYLASNESDGRSSISLRKSRSTKTLRPVSANYSAPPKRKNQSLSSSLYSSDAREIARAIARENNSIVKSTSTSKILGPESRLVKSGESSKKSLRPPKSNNPMTCKTSTKAKTKAATSLTKDHDGKEDKIALQDSMELTFTLLERVQCLSKEQQMNLLQMITTMDNSNRSYPLTEIHDQSGKKGIFSAEIEDIDTEDDEDAGKAGTEPAATPSPCRSEEPTVSNSLPTGHCVTIRGFSNWGARDVIGLTEIEFFDENRRQIKIDPSYIDVALPGSENDSPTAHVLRVVNGKKNTTNQSHMYLSSFQDTNAFFDVEGKNRENSETSVPIIEFNIKFPQIVRLSEIHVWNYNRSVAMSSAGIRMAEILMGGETIWSGEITKAHGNKMFNYSTQIKFIAEKSEHAANSGQSEKEHVVPKGKPSNMGGLLKDTITPLNTQNYGGAKQNETEKTLVETSKRVDIDILYEVGKENSESSVSSQDEAGEMQDLNNSDTPVWLKDKLQTNSDNNNSERIIFSPRDKRTRANDSSLIDRVIVTEGKYSENHGTNAQSPPPIQRNTKVNSLEESFLDSLAHFERNNRSRLSIDVNAAQEDTNRALVAKPLNFSPTIPPPPPVLIGSHRGGNEGKTLTVDLDKATHFIDTLEEIPATLMTYATKQHVSTLEPSKSNTSISNEAPVKFEIPILPSGRSFTIVIKSTWGDPHYVGLSGIEFFDAHGSPIDFNDNGCSYYAEPADINTLPEYNSDPRTVDKLFDNNNFTCDDMHVWLAPLVLPRTGSALPKDPAKIVVNFKETRTVSMIRIWNYNKSRIHSYRGARWIQIYADSVKIFDGEIRKASGDLKTIENCAEVLLFTLDEGILSNIEIEDRMLSAENNDKSIDQTTALLTEAWNKIRNERPGTGDISLSRPARARTPTKTYEEVFEEVHGKDASAIGSRPQTMALGRDRSTRASSMSLDSQTLDTLLEELGQSPTSDAPMKQTQQTSPNLSGVAKLHCKYTPPEHFISGRELEFLFLTTWGDPDFMGLTGIEVLVWEEGKGVFPYPFTMNNVTACPPDINIGGHTGDPRTLDKLIDPVRHTNNDRHMWLIPYTKGGEHSLRMRFDSERIVVGMNVWNYNKSPDDTFRGVQDCIIRVDGNLAHRYVSASYAEAARFSPLTVPGMFKFRKASGSTNVEFKQTIYFHSKQIKYGEVLDTLPSALSVMSQHIRQDYETPVHPCGHVFKLALLSTWGDPYYIGLDCVELYDTNGRKICVAPEQVDATPHSINVLDPNYRIATGKTEREKINNIEEIDGRLPQNILFSAGEADRMHWLAPLTTSLANTGICPDPNYLYFTFDHQVAISMVRIMNYSKTPNRGVSSIALSVDDALIYKGSLLKYDDKSGFQTILFTNNEDIIEKERDNITYCGRNEQHVLCINERRVMEGAALMKETMRGVGAYTSSYRDAEPRPKTGVSTRRHK